MVTAMCCANVKEPQSTQDDFLVFLFFAVVFLFVCFLNTCIPPCCFYFHVTQPCLFGFWQPSFCSFEAQNRSGHFFFLFSFFFFLFVFVCGPDLSCCQARVHSDIDGQLTLAPPTLTNEPLSRGLNLSRPSISFTSCATGLQCLTSICHSCQGDVYTNSWRATKPAVYRLKDWCFLQLPLDCTYSRFLNLQTNLHVHVCTTLFTAWSTRMTF